MAIKGLTDKKDKPFANLFCGKIHKGAPADKTNKKPGSDLGEKFRVEPANNTVRSNLMKAYPDARQDVNGDIILERLEIMFAYEDKEKTFDAWMKHWSTSALLRQCDRHTILFESELKEDIYGNPRHVQVPCDKPCPVRDEPIGVQCPLGCNQEANIAFYVRSPRIRRLGIDFPKPFQMTVTGYNDLDIISSFFDETLERFESLKIHNLVDYFGNKVPIGEWGINLPFILSRSQKGINRPILHKKGQGQDYTIAGTVYPRRTGKKTPGTAWVCFFEPDPNWLLAYEAERDRMETERRVRQQLAFVAEMRSQGLQLGAKSLGLLTGGAIDVEVIEPSTPPLPESTIAKEEWNPVYKAFIENGWTMEGVFNYLADLGYLKPSQIPVSRLGAIAAVAIDKTQMQHYNSLVF